MCYKSAQPTQRDQTEVRSPADLADHPARLVARASGPQMRDIAFGNPARPCFFSIQRRGRQKVVLEDPLQRIVTAQAMDARWDAVCSAGIETPAEPAGRPCPQGRMRACATVIDIDRGSLVHPEHYSDPVPNAFRNHRMCRPIAGQAAGIGRMLPDDSGFCLRTPVPWGGTSVPWTFIAALDGDLASR